jgi:hypothetical protein
MMMMKKKNEDENRPEREREPGSHDISALLSQALRTCGDIDHIFALQARNELGHQLPGLVAVPETPVYSDSEREHVASVTVWKISSSQPDRLEGTPRFKSCTLVEVKAGS